MNKVVRLRVAQVRNRLAVGILIVMPAVLAASGAIALASRVVPPPAAFAIGACCGLTVARVVVDPMARMYLWAWQTGEPFGPDPGSVFGWPAFEERTFDSLSMTRAVREERLLDAAGRFQLRESDEIVAACTGMLRQLDGYGAMYAVCDGQLVLTRQRLFFFGRTWYWSRGVMMGEWRGDGSVAADVSLDVDGDMTMRIGNWSWDESRPRVDVWVQTQGPEVLTFLTALRQSDLRS